MAAKLGRTESAKLVLELIEGNVTSPLLFLLYFFTKYTETACLFTAAGIPTLSFFKFTSIFQK
jgi:hypothetical protein